MLSFLIRLHKTDSGGANDIHFSEVVPSVFPPYIYVSFRSTEDGNAMQASESLFSIGWERVQIVPHPLFSYI